MIKMTMRHAAAVMIAAVCLATLTQSCDSSETYAEQREDERNAINSYISNANINLISENTFKARFDSLKAGYNITLTDTAKNEYVVFGQTGVYMQIIDQGCGDYLQSGQKASVSCRFMEWNLESYYPNPDSCQLTNMNATSISTPDVMTVTNTSGTFTASFLNGLMTTTYSSASVPAGWLVPLTYVKLGRPANEDERVAHVHIIVPASQGQPNASQYVYPCFYDLYYEKNK